MASMNIGGVQVTGDKIEVRGGTVYVDGIAISGISNTNGVSIMSGGTLEVRVLEGRLAELKADGSVHCGNVEGNASAGGSLHCDNIGGNANAGGSLKAENVRGNVNAGGSVKIGSRG